jgi:hypothetical protein
MALVPYNPAGRKKRAQNQVVAHKLAPEVKQYVKSQLSNALELNFFDLRGSFQLNPTIAPLVMNLIPAGSREGEVVNMQHVRFSFSIFDGSALPVYTTNARMIVFEWKALRLPVAADILESTVAAGIIESAHRFTTRKFYRVIYDRKLQLNPSCAVGMTHICELKQKDAKKRFDDGVAPSQTLGLLYFLVVSSDATLNAPVLVYDVRTTFTDA